MYYVVHYYISWSFFFDELTWPSCLLLLVTCSCMFLTNQSHFFRNVNMIGTSALRKVLKRHYVGLFWGFRKIQDKAKGMDAYPSSSTLYISMNGTISKHNTSLQQQMNCEQVPIKYSRG